jgi:microcystin-dependent protein
MYGGDGKSTFALPNMQDNAANSFGQGPGLSDYFQGEMSGTPTVTLLISEIPLHSHFFNATTNAGTVVAATNNQPGLAQTGTKVNTFNANIYSTNPNLATTQLSPIAIGVSGGSLPHNNMQPYLTLNFCIAMQGVFPPRS